jgi:3D (Asp-Asp-Asp) domain-containing protein
MRKLLAALAAATPLAGAAEAADAMPVAPARTMTVSSTAYCLRGTMANGRRVHVGAVAFNYARLGARISVSRSPYGPGRFTVEDRIGSGSQLDFWVPSCARARAWGRRSVRVTF